MSEPATGTVLAAGGVVIRRGVDGAPEVALVHRPKYDDWAFPKGKLLPGESALDGALREVREETGLRCRAGRSLGEVRYTVPSGAPKVVHYWMMAPVSGTFVPNREVDDLRWVALSEAPALLSYGHDRDLLGAVPSGVPVDAHTTIYLVRHSEAGDRSAWEGPDEARPLTAEGRRQASDLGRLLAGRPFSRVVSSPYVRCIQTIEPLAAARGVPIETSPALGEGSGVPAVLELMANLDGSAVLCTHGDVVDRLITHVAASGARLDGNMRWPKGSTWILDVDGNRVAGAHYLAPP